MENSSRETLENLLDCREMKPVNSKGNQSWIFIGKTDAEAETPILWAPDVKNWIIGKDSDAGRDWRQDENRMTEDEMVGWHHRVDAHEFGQAPGVGVGQGSLVCCSPWGCKGSDMTERLNWTELITLWIFMCISLYGYMLSFLMAQLVKNLPANQEALVQFLVREDPLEKG